MVDVDAIFRYKSPDWDKLLQYGFELVETEYIVDIPIMRKQFTVTIFISTAGNIHFKVFEAESQEEYVLVHVPNVTGGFVATVRKACEKVLVDISNQCFRTELLKAKQTKRIVDFMQEYYDAKPEFLWEKYPNYAVFRMKESGKWFAVIMTVDRSKVGLSGHGNIEIIDLKGEPEVITQRVDKKKFFQAYHMNKKHWYTICLDGTVSDAEIETLIRTSYRLVASKTA